jgi:hypothetical protein
MQRGHTLPCALARSAGEYARGNVTTNGIESVFAVLKRGITGVFGAPVEELRTRKSALTEDHTPYEG